MGVRHEQDRPHIGPLLGGGLVLGYRCSSRCQHCLYGAGPHRRDGEAEGEEALELLLDELARRAPHAAYHIGGGEPFLLRERLVQAIDGLQRRGLKLEYVETNAAWATERAHVEETLEELADHGLRCLLISLSPFHAEFVPLSRTLGLIEAARRILPSGAFVWIPEFLADLRSISPTEKLDLDALLAERGDRYAQELADRYGLVPAGRAGRFLRRYGVRRPWRDVASGAPCRSRLTSTSHFHVDGQGNYLPGLCAGLVIPLEEVPGEVDLGRYPVLRALVRGGPAALVELAAEAGFVPGPGYASACDLCTDVRLFMWRRGGERYSELGPPGFYDERSLGPV